MILWVVAVSCLILGAYWLGRKRPSTGIDMNSPERRLMDIRESARTQR